jgi:copper chaperone CopZ
MRQFSLLVGTMGCRRCVREVTALLRDVPGVLTVVADATHNQVTLTGTMASADVLAAFVGTTHHPVLVDQPDARAENRLPRP